MTTFAVTMVRDEADIVEETVGWMVTQVDRVIVADNGSTDGTREILEALPVIVVDDPDPAYYQSVKMSALAGRARELGAEWVVPFDADEVWLSPHGRVADVLSEVGPEALVAPAPVYNYFATAQDSVGSPVERIRWRWRKPLPLPKVACRALPGLTIHAGNHGASFAGMDGPAADGLLEVRHFPYRSPEQFVSKVKNGAAAYAATDLPRSTGQHWREYGELIAEGGDEAGEAWFRHHFWRPDPENDLDLILDPAPAWSTSLSPG